jgi:hypothetical protein
MNIIHTYVITSLSILPMYSWYTLSIIENANNLISFVISLLSYSCRSIFRRKYLRCGKNDKQTSCKVWQLLLLYCLHPWPSFPLTSRGNKIGNSHIYENIGLESAHAFLIFVVVKKRYFDCSFISVLITLYFLDKSKKRQCQQYGLVFVYFHFDASIVAFSGAMATNFCLNCHW